MKKFFLATAVCLLFLALSTTSASAVVNDTVKVGLKYGSGALTTANLENAQGAGYAFGYLTTSGSSCPWVPQGRSPSP